MRPMMLPLIGILLATASSCTAPSPAQIPPDVGRFLDVQALQNQRLAELQTGWQRERQTLFEQRDRLESERAELARLRTQEPVVAAAILTVGELLLCLGPLLLAGMLLKTSTPVTNTDQLAEVLLLREDAPRSQAAPLALPRSPTSPFSAPPGAESGSTPSTSGTSS